MSKNVTKNVSHLDLSQRAYQWALLVSAIHASYRKIYVSASSAISGELYRQFLCCSRENIVPGTGRQLKGNA